MKKIHHCSECGRKSPGQNSRSYWKIFRLNLYIDERIRYKKLNVKVKKAETCRAVVETDEFKKEFKKYFPNETLDLEQNAKNIQYMVTDPRQYNQMKTLYKIKGYEDIF
jgi:hypothetical protein